MNFQELEKHCWAFLEDVDSVFGVYLDAIVGFGLIYHYYYEQQILPIALQAIQANPAFSSVEEYLASVDMSLEEGDPNTPEAEQLHQISQLRFGQRNKTGSDNWIFIANLCLISIYQFWEDHYRKRIAKALGKTERELQVPIMGDIRYLRRSIIHNNGIAIPEVARCDVLRWFKCGDRIALTKDQMKIVIRSVQEEIFEIIKQAEEV